MTRSIDPKMVAQRAARSASLLALGIEDEGQIINQPRVVWWRVPGAGKKTVAEIHCPVPANWTAVGGCDDGTEKSGILEP